MKETGSPHSDGPHGFEFGGVEDGVAFDGYISGSPLTPIQRAYVMILEDAVVGSRVAGYRTGLLRALAILEHVDPDAPGGTDPIDPRASQGRPEGGAR